MTPEQRALNTAKKLFALSPDELLQRITMWRMLHPKKNQALSVLVDAYKEVCRIRLEQVLED